jgi:hypothetical protein
MTRIEALRYVLTLIPAKHPAKKVIDNILAGHEGRPVVRTLLKDRIYDAIKRREGMTKAELAREVETDYTSLQRNMEDLVRQGLVSIKMGYSRKRPRLMVQTVYTKGSK